MISTNTQDALAPRYTHFHSISHHRHHSESGDSHPISQTRYDTFMQRFKVNQNELRSKFKNFIYKQKAFFPKTHQKFNQTFMTQEPTQVLQNVRNIRKEKQRLVEELNQNMNQSQYYLHRNQQFQKTCTILQRKMKKVASIRQDRKEEVIQLQSTLRSISESIHKQKRRRRESVIDSRDNIALSKLMCSRKKLSLADTVRNDSELFKSRIFEEKTQNQQFNKQKYRMVREYEKNAELSVSRVIEEKQEKAQEVKLERLFRQLAEKQEIQISAKKIKKDASSMIAKYKNKTIELQEKIEEYRKSLGERRVEQTPKINLLKYQNKRYFTQENQFSTKSGFLTASKQVNYADEPFDD